MKPYHKNPRTISDSQKEQLASSLFELGDLSGIIHDLNSDQVIGGNQRSGVFDINECEIELTHTSDEPDEQGTIAHGFIKWQGHRYAYRQVQWTSEQCEIANIRANKLGGEFDLEALTRDFETAVLIDSGYGQIEIDEILAELKAGMPSEESKDAEPQISRADELQKEWQVEAGQMWRLPSRTEGQEHRLICGDCTDADVVARVMGGGMAEMVWTDPPYGVAVGDKNKYLNSIAPSNRVEENGEIILDPFSGSGTTIIAAENLSRQCRACEISPPYVAVTLQRYQDAFNITPELVS